MHHEARMIKHTWQKADSSSIFTLVMKVMKHADQFNIRMFMCIIQCTFLQLYHHRKMLNAHNPVSSSTNIISIGHKICTTLPGKENSIFYKGLCGKLLWSRKLLQKYLMIQRKEERMPPTVRFVKLALTNSRFMWNRFLLSCFRSTHFGTWAHSATFLY